MSAKTRKVKLWRQNKSRLSIATTTTTKTPKGKSRRHAMAQPGDLGQAGRYRWQVVKKGSEVAVEGKLITESMKPTK